ncbi:hypothetical protein EGT74_06595 [Chitinophaga lutea]|uniref:Uncharacterized protein n=1 Tax=Chitinophaga lutea TaxID=2488634 RepID=A0A3N4Q0R8_9BACT|nr:hypothetical protein [Chitinophaga lutea]RPE13195.1 hypothetical protein EGT74_06595 [Chitinophaga lutea]
MSPQLLDIVIFPAICRTLLHATGYQPGDARHIPHCFAISEATIIEMVYDWHQLNLDSYNGRSEDKVSRSLDILKMTIPGTPVSPVQLCKWLHAIYDNIELEAIINDRPLTTKEMKAFKGLVKILEDVQRVILRSLPEYIVAQTGV